MQKEIQVREVRVVVTTSPSCAYTPDVEDYHVKLRNEVRVIRQKLKMNVEESFVICMKCGLGFALEIKQPVGRVTEALDFDSNNTGSIPVPASIATSFSGQDATL